MKATLKILAVATMIFAADSLTAQNPVPMEEAEPKWERKVRPVRIGAKLGMPNLVGGNLEYVTPLLNKKLAVSVDYSMLKSDWLGLELDTSEDEYVGESFENPYLDISYMEGGLNYYFFRPGSGLYGGVSYGILNLDGTIFYPNAVETINLSHSSVNVKLGAKLGGLFYFRPEIGYSFNPLPETFDVVTTYDDGSTETRNIDNPVGFLPSDFIANIGLGFAF